MPVIVIMITIKSYFISSLLKLIKNKWETILLATISVIMSHSLSGISSKISMRIISPQPKMKTIKCMLNLISTNHPKKNKT